MKKRAIILDLDNTIYPVDSIRAEVFAPVLELVGRDGGLAGRVEEVRAELMRRPFQWVARDFGFGEELMAACLRVLENVEVKGEMRTFEDYAEMRKLGCMKFLVTLGFTKLQWSKVERLGIREDFEEIFIVDPAKSKLGKVDAFRGIMEKYGLRAEELLVVGDDEESEIKAGQALGIETVLYNRLRREVKGGADWVIEGFGELWRVLLGGFYKDLMLDFKKKELPEWVFNCILLIESATDRSVEKSLKEHPAYRSGVSFGVSGFSLKNPDVDGLMISDAIREDSRNFFQSGLKWAIFGGIFEYELFVKGMERGVRVEQGLLVEDCIVETSATLLYMFFLFNYRDIEKMLSHVKSHEKIYNEIARMYKLKSPGDKSEDMEGRVKKAARGMGFCPKGAGAVLELEGKYQLLSYDQERRKLLSEYALTEECAGVFFCDFLRDEELSKLPAWLSKVRDKIFSDTKKEGDKFIKLCDQTAYRVGCAFWFFRFINMICPQFKECFLGEVGGLIDNIFKQVDRILMSEDIENRKLFINGLKAGVALEKGEVPDVKRLYFLMILHYKSLESMTTISEAYEFLSKDPAGRKLTGSRTRFRKIAQRIGFALRSQGDK